MDNIKELETIVNNKLLKKDNNKNKKNNKNNNKNNKKDYEKNIEIFKNRTSNFFIEIKDKLTNIYLYIDKIKFRLSINKLYYLFEKDKIYEILDKYEIILNKGLNKIVFFDNEDYIENMPKLIKDLSIYFLNKNENNFIDNLLKYQVDNIYKTDSVKLFFDKYLIYYNDNITKIKFLIKKILINKLKLVIPPNKNILIKILVEKKKQINYILRTKDGTPKNNSNKKQNEIKLILPYTNILLIYLTYLFIIIDILTFYYK